MSDNLSSNAKLFADDTSRFSVVCHVDTSTKELNNVLKKKKKKKNESAFKWKTSVNPDLNKQVQGVIFSRKIKKLTHYL